MIGLVSERDIVRAFAEFGADALTKRLAQVITARDCNLRGGRADEYPIMERIAAGKFRHIPVIERDQLVGIVSIGDIVEHRLCEWSRVCCIARLYPERIGPVVLASDNRT